MRSLLLLQIAALIPALAAPTAAAAGVVFRHTGDTSPTAEGWTEMIGSGVTGSEVTAGPVTGDLGFDSWFVDDDGSLLDELLWYQVDPSPTLNARAAANGWTLRTRLRVVDVPDTPGGSPMLLYRNGGTSFQMHFGTDADGDPIVQLVESTSPVTGPSFTLEGSGGGYHLFELVYDSDTTSADLFVDAVERLSDYDGFALAQSIVLFGAGSSDDVGRGHFNLVEFDVAPGVAPALPPLAHFLAVALLGTCGALLARRWVGGR